MVWLDGDILGLLDIVDALQDCQSVADPVDPHCFEVVVPQGNEGLADNVIFWREDPVSMRSSMNRWAGSPVDAYL